MKPPIAFAVVQSLYRTGFGIMAITSENRHRVFGRDVSDDRQTNRAFRDVLARYPTQLEAEAAMLRANEAEAAHYPLVKAARRALEAAERTLRDARLVAVQPPGTAPVSSPASRACDMPSPVWPADRTDGPEDE